MLAKESYERRHLESYIFVDGGDGTFAPNSVVRTAIRSGLASELSKSREKRSEEFLYGTSLTAQLKGLIFRVGLGPDDPPNRTST